MSRPAGRRYELVAGEVVAMAPERSSHALLKFRIARRLAEAIEAARLPCTVYPDGMVVEVLSPSTRAREGAKLEDYFRLSSICHYLIAKTENRTIIHHARTSDSAISTRIVRDGPILLDPPGIELQSVFAEEAG